MEYEVRFYFSKKKLENIISKLKGIKELKMNERSYEKTLQYDHPNCNMSFYSKDIDGRFRIRVTKSSSKSKCKISWKKRLSNTTKTDVNKEEEVELNIKYEVYRKL